MIQLSDCQILKSNHPDIIPKNVYNSQYLISALFTALNPTLQVGTSPILANGSVELGPIGKLLKEFEFWEGITFGNNFSIFFIIFL